MAESPILRTERLLIKPFSEEHLTARYVRWLNDRSVVRYSEQRHRAHTLDSCRDYWRFFGGTPNYFWAMIAHDPALGHIGTLNAYLDPEHLVADVGILIGEPSAWGTGLGTEAWKAVCQYLLGEVKVRKVTAGTLSVNQAMLGIMRKAGMVEDGRRLRQYLFEGQEVDIVYAAIFRDGV